MARLEVITGPMFSEKSTELIRRVRRAMYGKKEVLVIKPEIDKRTGKEIASRKKKDKSCDKFEQSESIPAHSVKSFNDIKKLVDGNTINLLAIDEAQFFEPWLVDAIRELLEIHESDDFVIAVAGLDMDYEQKPFGSMPLLMTLADIVLKLTAVCFKCGQDANLTYLKRNVGRPEGQILIGNFETYEARCRPCHKLSD